MISELKLQLNHTDNAYIPDLDCSVGRYLTFIISYLGNSFLCGAQICQRHRKTKTLKILKRSDVLPGIDPNQSTFSKWI